MKLRIDQVYNFILHQKVECEHLYHEKSIIYTIND